MINFYSIFHANFGFSVIPESHYPIIIDNCFWPIIELAEKYSTKFGLEFPATTLERIQKEDPNFIKKIIKLHEEGKIEIIGSGFTQIIGPITPYKINKLNIEKGIELYKSILGFTPDIYYINEQAYSESLIGIYNEFGIKAIIMDWVNVIKYQDLPNEYRYSPQYAGSKSSNEVKLPIIWNDFINFQKFQRYIYGEINLHEINEFYSDQFEEGKIKNFPLYGSDWEIFDLRPGEIDAEYIDVDFKKEISRLEELIVSIIESDKFNFIGVSEVQQKHQEDNLVYPNTPECPLPVKKQDYYNILRWGVSGRADVRINTICHKILRNISDLYSLIDDENNDEIKRLEYELLELWSSDYRTHSTEEKYARMQTNSGSTLVLSEKLVQEKLDYKYKKTKNDQLVIYNPLDIEWNYFPFEFDLKFNPGEFKNLIKLKVDDKEIKSQIEQIKRYKDGSIRSCHLVIQPIIKPNSAIIAIIEENSLKYKMEKTDVNNYKFSTENVKLEIFPDKGATIKKLEFPKISDKWIIGHIDHGYYYHPTYSPDWFSGHTVIVNKDGKKFTDLGTATESIAIEGKWEIRVPVYFKTHIGNAELWKTYYLYKDHPLLEINNHFRFPYLQPESFRYNILTFNPKLFNNNELRFSTNNGSNLVESYPLNGHILDFQTDHNQRISAKTGVSGTNSWISYHDNMIDVSIISPKTKMFSMSLLEYRQVKDDYFLRLYNTIAENDDTNLAIWKGHMNLSTLIYGSKSNSNIKENLAQSQERGLKIKYLKKS